MSEELDRHWMTRALELAQNARGLCAPNPMVGAVVVRNQKVVGEGWHHRAGEPHAEPNALNAAGDFAKGATLYVTLEPCTTWGRTPPCTDRIIAAGIQRVVFGSIDRNPRHVGAACRVLTAAGISVESGVLRESCDALNEDFFWWIEKKRPFVTLKMAMTLDGRIATESGKSQWITGNAAREYVQFLRKGAGAVMVGGETVRKDNPSLLIRDPNYPRQPERIVWTSGEIPPSSQMLHDGGPAPRRVKPCGPKEWLAFLSELGEQNITNLLLEGGGELAASALQSGIVNKLCFFQAPKILCGRGSRPVVCGRNPLDLAEAIGLRDMNVEKIGEDFLFTAYPENTITSCSLD